MERETDRHTTWTITIRGPYTVPGQLARDTVDVVSLGAGKSTYADFCSNVM